MRFTHPELYEGRDGLPKDTALAEFRRRGLLHRGMSGLAMQKLLGAPDRREPLLTAEGEPNREGVIWTYGLHASTLQIELTPDGTVRKFSETTDGDKTRTSEW